MAGRVRVYMGCSFDGFVAGVDHDIEWMNTDYSAAGDLAADPAAVGFEDFMADVGAILMGRNTYAVPESYGQWPYGETPVLVATRRELTPMAPTVRAVQGPIDSLVAEAQEIAGDKDVYLDGGDLVQQALNANLIDELVITMLPVILGGGVRLLDQLQGSTRLQFTDLRSMDGGMLQVRAHVVR